MRVKLASEFSAALSGQPEDGMGYHRVDITFADGRQTHNVLVFNGEVCYISSSYHNTTIVKVTHRDQG